MKIAARMGLIALLCAPWTTTSYSIAQENIVGIASVIDGELAPPAVVSGSSAPHTVDNLGGAVEMYLSSHFSGFPNGVPPPGLYHRVLREIEVPLLTAALAATRGNQIRAADLLGLNRNTLRKKIQFHKIR